METARTGIAFVGCGFVADLYARTLPTHPGLDLIGVFDRLPDRTVRFAGHYRVRGYPSLDAVLADPAVGVVVNLTNPGSHAEVTAAALRAGKHVYTEKPLATTREAAADLVALARDHGRVLVAAPCSTLGPAAGALARAVRGGRVGTPRLVYAEMDDGPVHRAPYAGWVSASGAPWPWRDEFKVGCTLEHAGYVVPWLCGLFGPVRVVHAFAALVAPDKAADLPPAEVGPDFSVACLTFGGGVVARLTCGLYAPHDHRLVVHGDAGVATVNDTWDYLSPVTTRRYLTVRRRHFLSPLRRRVRADRPAFPVPRRLGAARMDFLLGVEDLAAAARTGAAPRLTPEFSLHVTEVVLAVHEAAARGFAPYTPATTFDRGPLAGGPEGAR